jgi:hypothetical protein
MKSLSGFGQDTLRVKLNEISWGRWIAWSRWDGLASGRKRSGGGSFSKKLGARLQAYLRPIVRNLFSLMMNHWVPRCYFPHRIRQRHISRNGWAQTLLAKPVIWMAPAPASWMVPSLHLELSCSVSQWKRARVKSCSVAVYWFVNRHWS